MSDKEKLEARQFAINMLEETLNEIAELVGYKPDHNTFSGDELVKRVKERVNNDRK